MKKEFRHQLFSFIFTLVLLYPLGADFVHILVKHHNVGYKTKSVVQIQKEKPSYAIYHHLLNYNTPLISNIFVLNVYNLVEISFFFKPVKFHDLNHYDFALRAPPFC